MNFLTFSKVFILFILHIANKPSNKKKVQSHLHTAIYNDCLSYEKTAMIAAVFFCADDGKRFFQKHRDPVTQAILSF